MDLRSAAEAGLEEALAREVDTGSTLAVAVGDEGCPHEATTAVRAGRSPSSHDRRDGHARGLPGVTPAPS
jgi:hypothetical protein